MRDLIEDFPNDIFKGFRFETYHKLRGFMISPLPMTDDEEETCSRAIRLD